MNEFNEKKARICVVAVGGDDRYAIVTSEGSSWRATKASGFGDKMHEIECDDIRSITFWPDDTWAIVMKTGFCHCRAFRGNDGPLDAINEHQNEIKYVGMTDNKEEYCRLRQQRVEVPGLQRQDVRAHAQRKKWRNDCQSQLG